MRSRSDAVVVVGGGVIGLASAFELAVAGCPVTVVDPDLGRGASWAAAGMLSPATEATPTEAGLLADLCRSFELWPGFAERVEATSGASTGFEECTSLLVGSTPSDRREVDRTARVANELGLKIEELSPTSLQEIEPVIGLQGIGGWAVRDDRRVDNRACIECLVRAATSLGVRFVAGRCTAVDLDRAELNVQIDAEQSLTASTCVVATGASAAPRGLDQLGMPSVRPVRGITIRLGAQSGVKCPRSTIRGVVDSVHCYLVPRADGSVAIGSTSEERGYEQTPLAGGVHQLLDAARILVPAIDEMRFDEVAVGLRPATSDHVPFVGRLADPRVIAAVGHYRNGLLLAPLAAREVAALVAQG